MVKYSLIVEYLKKGNNYSQIATLCGCSRTTVWAVVKRIDYFKIQLADIDGIDEVGLRSILFPERVRKDEKYLNGRNFKCGNINLHFGCVGEDIVSEL